MPKLVIRPQLPAALLFDEPAAEWFYIADHHFSHTKIIRYCQRPFPLVDAMDRAILYGLREVEEICPYSRIVIAGDLAFDLLAIMQRHGWLQRPHDHVFVAGNYHRVSRHRSAYETAFGSIVGTEKTWATHNLLLTDYSGPIPKRVLVSHIPLPTLHEADVNVYGHLHDNLISNPAAHDLVALGWLLDSSIHFNATVELNAYSPRRLSELAEEQGRSTLRQRIPNLNARRTSLKDDKPQLPHDHVTR